MNQRNALLLLLLASLFCSLSTALKCYAGSRGYVNGELIERFHEEECEENMVYCIESFSESFETITASCQKYGTTPKQMALCKSGKAQQKSGVTIRCCTTDLCNNKSATEKMRKTLS